MSYGYQGKLLKNVEEISKPKVLNYELFEENEATIEYVCNGRVLVEGCTFNDIRGEMTCKDTAIEESKNIVKSLKLKKDSDLVIRTKVKTYQIKKKDVGSYCNGEKKYENIGYQETTKEEIVWSSDVVYTEGVKDGI